MKYGFCKYKNVDGQNIPSKHVGDRLCQSDPEMNPDVLIVPYCLRFLAANS